MGNDVAEFAGSRLIVLGASPNMARSASDLPCEVVYVADDTPRMRSAVGPDAHVIDHDASTLNDPALLDLVAKQLMALRPVERTAVVAVAETALQPASELCEVIGAIGTPKPVVAHTKDKAQMREVLSRRLPQHNVLHARAPETDRVRELLRRGPVIVKPTDGTGSLHVRRCGTWEEFLDLPDEIRVGAQVEELVEGIEVTVESLSRAGVHQIFGIVEKVVDKNFVELGHIMPPPSLSPAAIAEVSAATIALLDALEIDDCASCTEVIWNPDGVKIVETHTRLGGDGLADLIHATAGVDWRRAALGAPLQIDVHPGPPRAQSAAMVFFTAPPGTVTKVGYEPPTLPGVTFEMWNVDCKPGDSVHALESSASRLGCARFTAPDAVQCRDALYQVLNSDVVQTVLE